MRRYKITWIEKKEYSTEFEIDDEMDQPAQEAAYEKQIEEVLQYCTSAPECEVDPDADPVVDWEVEEVGA